MKRAALLLCLSIAPCAIAQSSDDDSAYAIVEQYLSDLTLDELRAEYLEGQLDTLGGAERVSIARRLADLYAHMLREARDDTQRQRLEERAGALLDAIPQVESDELRLSLSRANFERAESVLERWRLRAIPESEARGAIRSMEELATTFDRLGREAHDRIQRLESREERARDADLPVIEARINESIQRRSSAFYLAGWAHRYNAEFAGDRDAARRSRLSFGWLLNAQTGEQPDLERVPEGYESLPHISLAMLCVSYTHALSGRDAVAERWYERVASSDAIAPDVRTQLATRRLIALCAASDWSGAARVLTNMDAADPSLVLTARLGAVLASAEIDRGTAPRDAIRLRNLAMATLVARSELGQAVEVIEAFDSESVDSSGYVGGLLSAVVAYQRVRETHRESADASKPATDSGLIARYASIASDIERALASPDALQYQDSQAGAYFVMGMSRYYAGAFADAADDFVKAATLGTDTPTEPDALWMAVLSLDTESIQPARRDALVDRFLTAYPDHPRASSLAMRRALQREDDPERSIALLLAIDPSEGAYLSARRQAARLAYRQAVEAPAPLRASRGRRYLDIAEPLLAMDRRSASENASAAERAKNTARRILNIALRLDTPDTVRASRAFDAIDAMAEEGQISTADFEGELLFRRAELALALDDVPAAEEFLRQVEAIDPDLAAQGDRLIWRRALVDWRRVRERGDASRVTDAARRVVRIGERLVDELGEPESALQSEASASVYRAVARAGSDLWRTAQDEDARQLSQRLFGELIEHGAESRDTLSGFVEMARAGLDFEAALDAQRRLVASLQPGTRDWFGARTLQLELLFNVDVLRAREAFRQHRALYPNLAPEPWKTRLLDLERRLDIADGDEP